MKSLGDKHGNTLTSVVIMITLENILPYLLGSETLVCSINHMKLRSNVMNN
jgi:hypothetical protein